MLNRSVLSSTPPKSPICSSRQRPRFSPAATETVERICNSEDSEAFFDKLKTPVHCRQAIRTSWNRGDKTLWGRLDFSYSAGQLKLLEFNFDGAVSLYESAIFQRAWFEELQRAGALDENTAQSIQHTRNTRRGPSPPCAAPGERVHFAAPSEEPEEADTVKYLQSCAVLAGLETQFLQVTDIGHGPGCGLFDLQNRPIKKLVKLYPWEYLIKQEKVIAEKNRSVCYDGRGGKWRDPPSTSQSGARF